ncbi:predicted protein [Chaetoceros tenuissimus]|uniref:Uncharacterized protein n=1 Tax=Chaetoceros tenuissimus TaxID=426638 RepID=A0AAD3CDN0_9STRA|nr:predicted protein [Chaetoceros tenuissimus]
MMKLLNTILLLISFTGHVIAQNNCACYPLQYNFRLDLLDLKKACDYTYENGNITDNNSEGPSPIPPGIANLDLLGGASPEAFEYVGCSTQPDITNQEIAIFEIEEFGPIENSTALQSFSLDPENVTALDHNSIITYDSVTAFDPTAIVKTLKVYIGLKGVNATGDETDQDFEFEVRYSNICNAVPYTENDFAGYLNFDSSVFPDQDLCFRAPTPSPTVACDEGSKGSKSSSKGSKSSSKGSGSSSKGSKSSSKGSSSSSKGSKSSKSCKSPKSPTMSKGSKSSSFKSPTLSSSKGKGSSSSGKGSKSTSLKLRRREA